MGQEIRVERSGDPAGVAVAVGIEGRNLEARYDAVLVLVMRMGSWLSSPQAQLLSMDVWELHFQRYQEQLESLRRLGDELRAAATQGTPEPLPGDALVDEVMELFAA